MAQSDALGHHVLIGLGGREFDVHRLVACLSLCDQVGQRQIGIRASHEVAVVMLQQLLLGSLGHTAQDTDDEWLSRGLGLQSASALGIEGFQTVIDLLFCIISYRARVEEHGICLVQFFGGLIASHLHHRGHHLGVSHIHLATIGFNI